MRDAFNRTQPSITKAVSKIAQINGGAQVTDVGEKHTKGEKAENATRHI